MDPTDQMKTFYSNWLLEIVTTNPYSVFYLDYSKRTSAFQRNYFNRN